MPSIPVNALGAAGLPVPAPPVNYGVNIVKTERKDEY